MFWTQNGSLFVLYVKLIENWHFVCFNNVDKKTIISYSAFSLDEKTIWEVHGKLLVRKHLRNPILVRNAK